MKAFVIIMLSVLTLSTLATLRDYVEKHSGAGVAIGLVFLAADILAIIFACKL